MNLKAAYLSTGIGIFGVEEEFRILCEKKLLLYPATNQSQATDLQPVAKLTATCQQP
jgi:hypothetical protein